MPAMSIPPLLLTLTATIVALSSYIVYQAWLHPLSRYPGPFIAKLTNLWRCTSFLRGTQHLTDVSLHTYYGPIVRDGPDSLLIADLNVFRTVYGSNKPEIVGKGDFYRAMWNKDAEQPNVFAAGTEAQHKAARAAVVPGSLAPKHIAGYMPAVQSAVSRFVADIEDELRDVENMMVDISPAAERFTFDAILTTTFGTAPPRTLLATEIIAAKRAISAFSIATGQIPVLARFLSIKRVSELLQRPRYDSSHAPIGLTAVKAWTTPIFRSTAHKELGNCMLRNLRSVSKTDAKCPDEARVEFECMNAVFAGTGSTAAALVAVLYELACHPEWQTRVLSSPTDLALVVKESLRLHPPFAAPFERVLSAPCPGLPGVPVGTRVWSNPRVIMRNPEVWGADAAVWKPERWQKGGGERRREMEDVWCVFGRGTRACIGRELAMGIVERAVVGVVGRWELGTHCSGLEGKNWLEMQYTDVGISLKER